MRVLCGRLLGVLICVLLIWFIWCLVVYVVGRVLVCARGCFFVCDRLVCCVFDCLFDGMNDCMIARVIVCVFVCVWPPDCVRLRVFGGCLCLVG